MVTTMALTPQQETRTGRDIRVREAKYTQGFQFGHNSDYARAVVERACSAVHTLMHDTIAIAERQCSHWVHGETEQIHAYRETEIQGEIIQSRVVIEQAVLLAVICAFVELDLANRQANDAEMTRRLLLLDQQHAELLDLRSLFQIDDLIRQATNRNRPLLVHLAAQLATIFNSQAAHLDNMPLSPAVLVSGLLAGLQSVRISVLAKRLLFKSFEQEFLARLTLLTNSIITRLEAEDQATSRATGFDEESPGPIGSILKPAALDVDALHARADELHQVLADMRGLPGTQRLLELSAEASLESLLDLVQEANYLEKELAGMVLRQSGFEQETLFLQQARVFVASKLDAELVSKQLPAAVQEFLQTLWKGVLFDTYVYHGENSEAWQALMSLQQDLLTSVQPISDASARTSSRSACGW